MHIVNDLGTEMVNGDNVFSFALVPADKGGFVLAAFSPDLFQQGPLRTALVVGSKDRCEQALAAIRKGIKDRQHIVDLLGLLGQRPDITVAQPKIVLPGNGGPS